MNQEDVIAFVLQIPRRYAVGNDSPMSLLVQSGYIEHHAEIGEQRIRNELAGRPDLLGEWEQYSDDQRSDGGWFLARGDAGEFEVRYMEHCKIKTVLKYSTRVEACAAFVKNDLELVRRFFLSDREKAQRKEC